MKGGEVGGTFNQQRNTHACIVLPAAVPYDTSILIMNLASSTLVAPHPATSLQDEVFARREKAVKSKWQGLQKGSQVAAKACF